MPNSEFRMTNSAFQLSVSPRRHGGGKFAIRNSQFAVSWAVKFPVEAACRRIRAVIQDGHFRDDRPGALLPWMTMTA